MIVLTYHSHHVVGDEYARNDHIAFPIDLRLITELGFEIVPLDMFVDALEVTAERKLATEEKAVKLVALTFDDGPVYDVADFVHPDFGPQASFLSAMRDFRAEFGPEAQRSLSAISFVIASPEARRIMERTFDTEFTYPRGVQCGPAAGSQERHPMVPAKIRLRRQLGISRCIGVDSRGLSVMVSRDHRITGELVRIMLQVLDRSK